MRDVAANTSLTVSTQEVNHILHIMFHNSTFVNIVPETSWYVTKTTIWYDAAQASRTVCMRDAPVLSDFWPYVNKGLVCRNRKNIENSLSSPNKLVLDASDAAVPCSLHADYVKQQTNTKLNKKKHIFNVQYDSFIFVEYRQHTQRHSWGKQSFYAAHICACRFACSFQNESKSVLNILSLSLSGK